MGDFLTRTEHTDSLELVGRDIDAVARDVAQLADAVGGVLDVLEQPGSLTRGGGRWRWRTLTGHDRAALWTEVRDWVGWFNTRYGAVGSKTAIPPCWPSHPVAVEEITALMVAWQGAHDVAAPSDALAAWHDRWLWPCLDRLHTKPGGFKDCTLAKHELRHTVHVPAVTDDAFNQIVRDDLAAHPHLDANTDVDVDSNGQEVA